AWCCCLPSSRWRSTGTPAGRKQPMRETAVDKSHSTSAPEEGVVVGISSRAVPKEMLEEYLDELVLLADTAGVTIVHKFSQERIRVSSATYIGKGKAEEIGEVVTNEKIKVVIFDDDLSPVQIRNLEKKISCKILDRS